MRSAIQFILSSAWLSAVFLHGAASAQEVQSLYRSAYFLGRGDTGIAIADNEDAIFYNPAGLAYGKGVYKKTIFASPTIELSNSTKDLVREAAIENNATPQTLRKYVGSNQHLGVYNFSGIVLRRAAIGLLGSLNNNILVSKSKNNALEQVSLRTHAYGGGVFSLADSFFKDALLVGFTGKYLQKYEASANVELTQYDDFKEQDTSQLAKQGAGGGADLGFMLRGSSRIRPSAGLTIQNIGHTQFVSDSPDVTLKPLYQKINVGVAIEPGTKVSSLKLLADYYDLMSSEQENIYKKLHFGAELNIREVIGITGGLNQGYPTGGFFLDMRLLRFDLGFYTEETGEYVGHRGDSRFFFRLTAGF